MGSFEVGRSEMGGADPWRGFAGRFAAVALGAVAVLFGFVVLIDPWGSLPVSLPLERVPISGNARFSFPALARSPRFDAAVFGTSTSRLLQPAQLDGPFGARFVNLAMNSATAWEQTRLLGVFLRAHEAPKALLIGLDPAWCGTDAARLTPRPFPAWMYAERGWPGRWGGYREALTPFAVQEAANQLAVLAGWKRPPYGLDGYTRFVPDDAAYDRARRDAQFARWSVPDASPARVDAVDLPNMALLAPALAGLPPQTRLVLFFPPIHAQQHGAPGSRGAQRWAACKAAAAAVAAAHGGVALDAMRPGPFTADRDNYWDPLHFRAAVAARLAVLLAGAEGEEIRRIEP